MGPSFSFNRSTPEAKKFAVGATTSFSRFICVMKRGPLIAKRKFSGVCSYQDAKLDGRCIE